MFGQYDRSLGDTFRCPGDGDGVRGTYIVEAGYRMSDAARLQHGFQPLMQIAPCLQRLSPNLATCVCIIVRHDYGLTTRRSGGSCARGAPSSVGSGTILDLLFQDSDGLDEGPICGQSSMRVMPGWRGYMLAAVIALGILSTPAEAQSVRSPELNLQYHRAEVAWRSGGSVLEAKARVDRVLSELPEDVEALKLRAQVLMSLQRPEEAVSDARKAALLDAADGEAHLILAEAALACGEHEVAIGALGRAADRVLNDASSHVRMSWVAAELDRIAWAEAFARTALALDGRDPAAYYQLARVFLRQQKRDQAAEILARGLRASMLDATAIGGDRELSDLLQHPVLKEFAP